VLILVLVIRLFLLRWPTFRKSRNSNNSFRVTWDFGLTNLIFHVLFQFVVLYIMSIQGIWITNSVLINLKRKQIFVLKITSNKAYTELITESEYQVKRKIYVILMAYKRVLGLNPSPNLYLSWFIFKIFWWECFLKRLAIFLSFFKPFQKLLDFSS